MPRKLSTLDRIQQLDPNTDDQEIVKLTFFQEFPWDGVKSLEFALFRTYAAPSVVALLDATGELRDRTQKRYDDTDLLIANFMFHGYDSDVGRRAIRRMNQLHGRFNIPNDDYIYLLSTFVFEPIRWMQRFGWRPMCDQEQQALLVFWQKVATLMAIQDVPESLEALEAFNVAYERENFGYSEVSQRVAESTRDLYLGFYFPKFLWRFGEPFLYALMDDPLLEAFGFPKPSRARRWFVEGLLRSRARLIRRFPARRSPKDLADRGRRTYPNGVEMEDIGPDMPTDIDASLLKRSAGTTEAEQAKEPIAD
jgi:hypothetical protein